jgi:hypothetical protein
MNWDAVFQIAVGVWLGMLAHGVTMYVWRRLKP